MTSKRRSSCLCHAAAPSCRLRWHHEIQFISRIARARRPGEGCVPLSSSAPMLSKMRAACSGSSPAWRISRTAKASASSSAWCDIAARPDAIAARAAEAEKIHAVILGDAIEGEARSVARDHAAKALACLLRGRPARPPCVLLSGGETTVTVKGKGRGGRSTR